MAKRETLESLEKFLRLEQQIRRVGKEHPYSNLYHQILDAIPDLTKEAYDYGASKEEVQGLYSQYFDTKAKT